MDVGEYRVNPLAATSHVDNPMAMGGAVGELSVSYSLYFDGDNDEVDCGTDPSVMNLHQSAFTVDCYWQMPDMSGLANGTIMGLVSQGRWTAPGWCLIVQYLDTPRLQFYLDIDDGGGTPRTVARGIDPAPAVGTWVYIRGRKDAAGNIYLSLDAGEEGTSGPWVGATYSTDPLRIGHSHNVATAWGYGNIAYVCICDDDQGELEEVPSSPPDHGEDAVARYLFTEGEGDVLGDDIGENDGEIDGATWEEDIPSGWSAG